ncbi:N-acetylmuramic acid 6-phosphate etherase [Pseudoalteromonas sp. T1lg48]|uniref:N-acetylmuramic acid 6-phosphate etherase n=1 Tax=Pseudoalteromonas sp. T1lg48 TaxID=2077100 RepID=UPI000CF614E9|nr:N-acetylmuramic acid 6-phosphate etherase [Pseudoalteromonas sp. T1lg48]
MSLQSDHNSKLLRELNTIVSEGQNPQTLDIDLLPTEAILRKLNDEDQKVAPALREIIADIAKAVDAIVAAFSKGGRLIYIGAGTSGRLGVLDAAECPPTFSVAPGQVVGIIAGGERAIQKAVEGAEDNAAMAIEDLKSHNLSADDVVVGIAASGRTPYVVSALKYARQQGCVTVGISCSPNSAVLNAADIPLAAVVGPEALTGSTRLKSGTAQKLVLNMLSTASMIRSGKVYRNLMVDVNASNDKLKARAVRIVMQATECSEQEAVEALAQSEQSAKLAILMLLTGKTASEGKALLDNNKGFLRSAVQEADGDA